MTVSTSPPINSSIANGATTVFPYQFRILAAEDLYVSVDGVRKTLNVHYAVDGVGDVGGGDITFTGGNTPANGSFVLRMRLMDFERTTDYQTGGELRASEVNNDFDAAVMMIQQLAALAMLAVDDGNGALVWDALGRRIVNLGDAINDQDAVNLRTLLQKLGDFTSLGLNVTPLYWELPADGVETEFFIPGADVAEAIFYDVLVDGVMIEPGDGFSVLIAPDPDGSKIVFVTPPANASETWVILRGYAKPVGSDLFTNETFLQLLRDLITNTLYETTTVLQLGPTAFLLPLYDVVGTAETINGSKKSYLLRTTNAAATTLTIRANTGIAALDWDENPIAAPFFSVKQSGAGQVSIVGDVGVTVTAPAGYLPKTRAENSIITATGDYVAGGQWVLSGDLAIDETYVPGGALSEFNKVLAAANSSNVTAPATVPGWTFNVAAGKAYRIRVLGTYQTAATTTGGALSILGAGGVAGSIAGKAAGALSAAAAATALAIPIYATSGSGSSLTTTGVSAINTPHWIELDVVFLCTANGTLSIQWASEVAASAAQLNAGTGLFVKEMSLTP